MKYYFILSLLALIACDTKQSSQIAIKESPRKDSVQTTNAIQSSACLLKYDTFSFKGIRLGDRIENVSKKYSLRNAQYTDGRGQLAKIFHNEDYEPPSSKTYLIKDTRLTLFGNMLNKLYIYTFQNKVYGIDLYIEENEDEFFHIDGIVRRLAERYNAENCRSKSDKDLLGILPVLELSNNNLSIMAFVSSSGKKKKRLHPELKNSVGVDNFTDLLRIEVTDKLLYRQYTKAKDDQYNKKGQQKNNDF
jgi:hypothetical protein